MTCYREDRDKERKELTLRKEVLVPRVTTGDLDVQFDTKKCKRTMETGQSADCLL